MTFRKSDGDVSIAAYRIVQECLTNIVRHAGASRAEISVKASEILELVVQDNGKGLPEDHASREERFGLMGMRERAEGLGGTFSLHSEDGVRINVTYLSIRDGAIMSAIRVMLVDDHAVVRMGFKFCFKARTISKLSPKRNPAKKRLNAIRKLNPMWS